MQTVQCSIFNCMNRTRCSSSLNFGSSTDNFLHLNYNLKQNEAQSARADSNKGVNLRSKDITHTQQQRPEWLTGTVTWHACKYKVHKLLVASLHRPTFCTYRHFVPTDILYLPTFPCEKPGRRPPVVLDFWAIPKHV